MKPLQLFWLVLLASALAVTAVIIISRCNPEQSDETVLINTEEADRLTRPFREKIDFLQAEVNDTTDSLFRLKTEYALLTVEKNRSEEKVKRLSVNIKKGIATRDTVKVVQDCDSLVNELDHAYIKNQIRIEQLTDSANAFYESIIANKDSIIAAYAGIDTTQQKIRDSLIRANQKVQTKLVRQKGATRLGIVGTVIAVTVAALSQ